jgi:hypothetical protein
MVAVLRSATSRDPVQNEELVIGELDVALKEIAF